MSKLVVGNSIPDFEFETPFESGCTLENVLQRVNGKTALVFLRYYGCTLCQYDIHLYAQAKDQIAATGGQMLVVLQSDPQKLAAQLKPGDLPFDIVCDPEAKLYKQFEINPAESQLKMADAKTLGKIAKAKSSGFTHGDYEGNELQLPAVFVMQKDRLLTHVHYAKSVSDVPSADELAELLR